MHNVPPVASDCNIVGDPITGNITLQFKTTAPHLLVTLSPSVLHKLICELAKTLAACPVPEMRSVGQCFAIRSISAQIDGMVPVLSYECESGIALQTSIEKDDAQKLHNQLSEILPQLSSLDTSFTKH